jgi:hypothetical protein
MSDAAETNTASPRWEVDREALLVALVLAPATYSRNRFYDMYRDPEVRAVRRRASLVRSIVRHLTRRDPKARGQVAQVGPCGAQVELVYVVPALGLRRTALLDPIEISLVRFALGRSASSAPELDGPTDDGTARAHIESVLARLAP